MIANSRHRIEYARPPVRYTSPAARSRAQQVEQQQKQPAQPFAAWLTEVAPQLFWEWAYTRYIREHLDLVTKGEIKRLMIFIPPRHGKSELATIHYPAYRLEQEPKLRVVIGAYSSTLAEKFSRRTRAIVRRRSVKLDRERSTAADWLTEQGGGLRAVGVGGGITGQGGDLIVIDDPVKSREEADSPAYRDKVWNWYLDDIYTRREPGAAIILIMTRWHEDDLAGRILASDQASTWTVINLPALALADDPIGRTPGAALCPDRYDEVELRETERTLGPRGWNALYMQRPRPPDGAMFKREWFSVAKSLPKIKRWVRYWDLGGAAEGAGDYTVGALLGESYDGRIWIAHLVRAQFTANPRNKLILFTAGEDRARGIVKLIIEQAPGLAKESTDSLRAMLAKNGYTAHADKVNRDKVTRAEPLQDRAEGGTIALLQGSWNTLFLDELTSFPYSEHDDQVDAVSGAFNSLAGAVGLKRSASPIGNYRG